MLGKAFLKVKFAPMFARPSVSRAPCSVVKTLLYPPSSPLSGFPPFPSPLDLGRVIVSPRSTNDDANCSTAVTSFSSLFKKGGRYSEVCGLMNQGSPRLSWPVHPTYVGALTMHTKVPHRNNVLNRTSRPTQRNGAGQFPSPLLPHAPHLPFTQSSPRASSLSMHPSASNDMTSPVLEDAGIAAPWHP